jgi:hypothetical protein
MVVGNTLAYFKYATFTAAKRFMAKASGCVFRKLHFLRNLGSDPIS